MDRYLLEKGRWYLINVFGSRTTKAKLVESTEEGAIMKYYLKSYDNFRSRGIVSYDRIICECKRPKLFSEL